MRFTPTSHNILAMSLARRVKGSSPRIKLHLFMTHPDVDGDSADMSEST